MLTNNSSRPSHRRSRLAALATVLLVAMLASACASDGDASDNEIAASADGDRAAVAEWIGTELPASATNVQFEQNAEGIDDSAKIRFTIPATELDATIDSMDIGKELQAGRRGFPSSGPGWFETSDLTDFAGASGSNNGRAVQVMADLSNADTVDIYILAFTL